MRIVMVSSEVAPFSKAGGLGDVLHALPRALARRGHDVTVISPFYRSAREAGPGLQPTGRSIAISLGGDVRRAAVRAGVSEGMKLFFIDHPEYYDREDIYGNQGADYPDNAARFAFLARASLELLRSIGPSPDIVHAHDWPAALVPPLLKTGFRDFFPRTRAVLTIHNLAYQGLFNGREWGVTGLESALFNWQQLEFYGKINYLKGGIVFADAVTTVSPTYAREIQQEEFGCGLDGVLRQRADLLHGILNGVDYEQWDPRNDAALPVAYASKSLEGKSKCKDHLKKKTGLSKSKTAPLIGMVTRLVEQKGMDLFLKAAERLMTLDVQFVVLGSGSSYYEEGVRSLARRFPGRFAAVIGFDSPLSHEIEGGADMFLMPSKYEPCGLSQMYSLRYGTVPLVRSTGGLADTVVDVTSDTLRDGTGTGFVFHDQTPEALEACVQRAIGCYRTPASWKKIMRLGMRQDFSWDRAAERYESVYSGTHPSK